MKKNTRQYTADNIRTFDVKEETTLLPFLFDVLDNLSRSEVKSMLKFKHVALQGKAVTQFDTPLLPGAALYLSMNRRLS